LFASIARSPILFGPNRWPAGPPWRVALCLAQQKKQLLSWVGSEAPGAKAPFFLNLYVRPEALTHNPNKLRLPNPINLGATTAHFYEWSLPVRQHLVDVFRVRGVYLPEFLQSAHAVGFLGAQQVPLAGVHPHDFSGRRDLEALGGSAMCLQLKLLYLFCHESYLSRKFSGAAIAFAPNATIGPARLARHNLDRQA
jgi:hypothetical protein